MGIDRIPWFLIIEGLSIIMWLFKNGNGHTIYYTSTFLKCKSGSYFNPIFYLWFFFFRRPLNMTSLKICFKNNYNNPTNYQIYCTKSHLYPISYLIQCLTISIYAQPFESNIYLFIYRHLRISWLIMKTTSNF